MTIKKSNPISISVIISFHNNEPCIELRRKLKSPDLIKHVVSAAFHDEGLIIFPIFHDKLKSIGSLLEKGIIYQDKDSSKYYFTF